MIKMFNSNETKDKHYLSCFMHTNLSSLVGEQGVFGSLLAIGTRLKLGQVAVVVSLHLEVEDLRLTAGSSGDEVLIQKGQDTGTDFTELLLDLQIKTNKSHLKPANIVVIGASSDAPLRDTCGSC